MIIRNHRGISLFFRKKLIKLRDVEKRTRVRRTFSWNMQIGGRQAFTNQSVNHWLSPYSKTRPCQSIMLSVLGLSEFPIEWILIFLDGGRHCLWHIHRKKTCQPRLLKSPCVLEVDINELSNFNQFSFTIKCAWVERMLMSYSDIARRKIEIQSIFSFFISAFFIGIFLS